MDRISVTSAALQEAYVIINRFDEDMEATTENCASTLRALFFSLDDELRHQVQAYLEGVNALYEDMRYCVDQNKSAIKDRLGRIPEYESAVYTKTGKV